MINGMPGPMAVASAEACLRKGLNICPIAITGPNIESHSITVTDEDTKRSTDVRLIPSTDSADIDSSLKEIRAGMSSSDQKIVAIDFTHPSAVNENGLWYVEHDVPFVMGTTGGDREKLMQDVTDAKLFAVIAPNMAKQIVAMQLALEDLAARFPSSFGGYKLSVTESHQKTKADTSGTAKVVIDSLKTLSNDQAFTYDDINMLRDDDDSVNFGVPQEGINGHAFHTYTLKSADDSVAFELKHNVVGRRVYAEGTADAVIFLATKLLTEKEGKVYSMINVLEEGAME